MRGGPSVWTRTARLEAARGAVPIDLRALAERVAAEVGMDPAPVLAEAEAFAARCRAVGAVTATQIAELAAAELGLDPAEVWAEAERVAKRRV